MIDKVDCEVKSDQANINFDVIKRIMVQCGKWC